MAPSKLASQETRNAVYDGPLNKLCLGLSENTAFRMMWGIPQNPQAEHSDEDDDISDDGTDSGWRMFEKMADVELVLRFFAYRQISSFKAGLNKIPEFLDQFLIAGNNFSTQILEEYRSMFESTVAFLWDALGINSYCTLGFSARPTKIVFDPIMYVANTAPVIQHRKDLVTHKGVLREELENMYRKNQDLFAGRKTSFGDTQARNRCTS